MSHKPNIRLVKRVPDSVHVELAPFLPIHASTLKIRDNIAELAKQERGIMIATVANQTGNCITDLPDLDPLPIDFDWRCFPEELRSRVFDFSNDRGDTQETVDATYPYDPSQAAQDFVIHGGKCGLVAIRLSNDIRSALGLRQREKGAWNFEEDLAQAAGQNP